MVIIVSISIWIVWIVKTSSLMFIIVTRCKIVTRILRIVNSIVRAACRMVKLVKRMIKNKSGWSI